ncbi:C2H2 zinc finger [Ceratobasidium sp. AG-Ba]|nr:C2H2 zinc finger [Ceratobasidium sp. AG-Ba]
MFRAQAWTPRDSTVDDDWSDHHPSPLHPSYNDPSPASNWLSPVTTGDDVDMLFDFSQPTFISLVDDSASQREQRSMLERWRTPALGGKAKANPLSRQPTLDDIVIAGEWEEKIVRRYQRKRGLQNLSLREVKREMPPIEFDPAFADSDTEDEEPYNSFNPDALVDPPMRVRTPRLAPSPISIPAPTQFVTSAPLSPLTPLSSEPSPPSDTPPAAPAPVEFPPTPVSAVCAAPVHERAWSPDVKQEVTEETLAPSRASPAAKRPVPDFDRDPEQPIDDDALSEGEYFPSDGEEDDADPTYGAPKARRLVSPRRPRAQPTNPHTRVSTSHTPTHSRTASSDKPARGPARRRRPVDDAAPSQCTYESPLTGGRCPQIFARLPEMKRHIDHFHYEHEARAVIEGRLPRDQAKLLGPSWDGTLGKPTCEGCGTEFSRRDAVKRHQNEVKAVFENGRCVWCPGTQGRKGSAKRVAAAKLAAGSPSKRQRRK